MFSPQEVRNIESAAAVRYGQSYLPIEQVPIQFRDRVLEKRAKILGFACPAPVIAAMKERLSALLSL
jgi:hypothetical protein